MESILQLKRDTQKLGSIRQSESQDIIPTDLWCCDIWQPFVDFYSMSRWIRRAFLQEHIAVNCSSIYTLFGSA
ncbi:hypothetical protein GCK32_002519 [Trichostrongylus colubriformis]|uniref:Uncharacterized protein n=1 Tax=Trichostrongylus colubriformis TaxID=6319 RepID=A0AAN8IE30_TRICO